MLDIVKKWVDRYLSNEEAIVLVLLLVASFTVILTLGNVIAPIMASMVIAFLLQGMVVRLMGLKVPEWLALAITFTFFLGLLLTLLLVVLPLSMEQLASLVKELPRMVSQLQGLLLELPKRYPTFISEAQVTELVNVTATELGSIGQWVVSFSVSKLPIFLTIGLYLVLVPILVFFLLKDKTVILESLSSMLPNRRPLLNSLWYEMNDQMANYVRGKAIEIFVVGGVTFVAFTYFGLNYAALLALLVGLSVVIPYIGAAAVTIPVALVAFFQWGTGSEFVWLISVYVVIQALDGNVLVPLLFSEAVNLHPSVIVIAVIIFGGLWGMWGVFFAIPLATLIKAIINSWPRQGNDDVVVA